MEKKITLSESIEIIGLFLELTQDVKDIYSKPWLIVAITSHIKRSTGKRFSVNQIVSIIV